MESAYYSSEDPNIPAHIHEIFQKGLPADFRLVGATTRMPHELPPAIRSRCLEVFFRRADTGGNPHHRGQRGEKINFPFDDDALDVLVRFAQNGREAVNMVQIAAGIVHDRRTPAHHRARISNGLSTAGSTHPGPSAR